MSGGFVDGMNSQAMLLGVSALLLANWPFFHRGGSSGLARVALELGIGYGVCLLLARFLEARQYAIFPQPLLFYGITALLFLVFAIPGMLYRSLIAQRGDRVSERDDSRLIEEEISSQSLPVGEHFHWKRARVRLPDGASADREYLDHPGAVMILPVTDDGRVVFERQYRHPGRQVFIELPAGKLHPGEDKLRCAQRELLEETGYVADDWRRLGSLCPAIGYSNEIIEIYMAKKLRFEGQRLDEGEFIETMTLLIAEAVDAVLSGKIVDAKTIAGVFWLTQVDSGGLAGGR